MEHFTTTEALRVQSSQLSDWKEILNKETYSLLYNHCMQKNKELVGEDCGDKVFRGSDIDDYILDLVYEKFLQKNKY